ncbi:hypothetical protein BDW71DRAFT_191746 [Aspergillus fruticulosus]
MASTIRDPQGEVLAVAAQISGVQISPTFYTLDPRLPQRNSVSVSYRGTRELPG